YKTDIWVEIPAFSTVLVTGILMLPGAQPGALLLTKLVFALLAIAFNCVCVFAVFKRRASLRSGDVEGMAVADRAMRLGGAIVPTFLVALSLGLYLVIN